jgi:hypothetical protein
MRHKLNGRHGAKPGEAFTIGEGKVRDTAAQPVECQKAAAITALALAYEQELKARVRDGRLPYGLEYFLQDLGDELSTQVKAIGIADYVPGKPSK